MSSTESQPLFVGSTTMQPGDFLREVGSENPKHYRIRDIDGRDVEIEFVCDNPDTEGVMRSMPQTIDWPTEGGQYIPVDEPFQ